MPGVACSRPSRAIRFRVVEGLDVLRRARGGRRSGSAGSTTSRSAKPPDYSIKLSPDPSRSTSRRNLAAPRSPCAAGRSTPVARSSSRRRGRGLLRRRFPIERPVARWTLRRHVATPFVAARFGGVLVPQLEDEQPVTRIPILRPRSPGRHRGQRTSSTRPSCRPPLRSDDLRPPRDEDLASSPRRRARESSGSRPQGEAKLDRGGYELRSSFDPFFRRSRPGRGHRRGARQRSAPRRRPKWGKSAARVLIVPPDIGEPEALRYEGLPQGARRLPIRG